jgi:hypothetical protein
MVETNMSKYRKLTLHLAQLDRNEWRARFEEVERILEFRLCKSAGLYRRGGPITLRPDIGNAPRGS